MKIAYDILCSHGVTRLCHLTKFVALKHIFNSDDGILATAFLDNEVKRQNDKQRFDGKKEHVCCSVEYPNTWYLDKIRNDDPIFKNWAILCIDLDVLNHREVKYCACNASTNSGIFVKHESEDMHAIFAQSTSISGRVLTRKSAMLNCCPTDDQTEILIKRNVPRSFISNILLNRLEDAEQLYLSFDVLGIHNIPQVKIVPEIFERRTWSDKVRIGLRPIEVNYKEAQK